MSQRYIIRCESAEALPACLFKRLPGDWRHTCPDLDELHDLALNQRLTDVDVVWRRSFDEAEAMAACAEWHETQTRLDLLMSDARVTMVLQPVESFLLAAATRPLLRLLPLVREGGGQLEPALSVAAWASTRVRHSAGEHIFRRGSLNAPAACAEVFALRRRADGAVEELSSRVAVDAMSGSTLERYAFAERSWLASHFGGHDLRNAMSVAMTPDQAARLAAALELHPEFSEVAVQLGTIRDFVGSAEFEAGLVSRPVRFEDADASLCGAVAARVHWVVWPGIET